jgi:hypothetical protein
VQFIEAPPSDESLDDELASLAIELGEKNFPSYPQLFGGSGWTAGRARTYRMGPSYGWIVFRRVALAPLTLRKRCELKDMRDGPLGSKMWRLAARAASG